MSAPRPLLSTALLELVGRHGSPEERQLVNAWQADLARFLDHPDVQVNSRRVVLDIGLENRMVLKFNLMASEYASPWGMVDRIGDSIPSLAPLAETVLRHQLRCHVGVKAEPDQFEYELYAYETPDKLLANGLFSSMQVNGTKLPAPAYCYGLSTSGTLSAYANVSDVPAEELEESIGFRLPCDGLKTKALFHSRRQPDGTWRTDKAGIEFLPFPSHMLNAVLTRLDLRFAYLLHRGGNRPYGVIGVKGPRQVFYTTLIPNPAGRPPRKPGT